MPVLPDVDGAREEVLVDGYDGRGLVTAPLVAAARLNMASMSVFALNLHTVGRPLSHDILKNIFDMFHQQSDLVDASRYINVKLSLQQNWHILKPSERGRYY